MQLYFASHRTDKQSCLFALSALAIFCLSELSNRRKISAAHSEQTITLETGKGTMTFNRHRNTTLAVQAQRLAAECPDEIAIYFCDGSTLSYGQAWTRGCALASGLRARGVRAGETLSFQLPNGPEAVIVMMAAAIAGLVVNPIVPIYRERETRYILGHARTRVLFIPTSFRGFDYPAMIQGLQADCPELTHVICTGTTSEIPPDFELFEQVVQSGAANPITPAVVHPDDTKILLYTSGTTGDPKQVRHSHNTLTAALDNGREGWALTADDLMLMPSPVTHITGYVNGMEMPFLTPTKSLLMAHWNVDQAIDLIERVGATACVSATPFLKELVDTCQVRGKTLPGFRLFACGGASVPPALIHSAWDVLEDCRAVRVYGSTEVPLVTVGYTSPDERDLAAETDGRVCNYDVRIVDDNDNNLAAGEEGEILARGPAMMQGYGDTAQNREAFTPDGYFRTGDIGRLTNSGALLITDRKKDIIIRGGENIAAREIEEVLLSSDAIAEIAVVAVPHGRLGEGVGACVVTAGGQALDEDALYNTLSSSGLAKQKWPQHIAVYDALPKTASGKVQKEVLRQQLRDQGVSL